MAILGKAIERSLGAASRQLTQDNEWVDVIQALESARGVVKGSGPGGDL